MLRFSSCAFVLAALSSSACTKAPPAPPPLEVKARVRYELPSHRCAGKGKTCLCRDESDPADAPEQNPVPAGMRRFEVRLASLDKAVLLQFRGQPYELRPDGESPAASCWYLDLPRGSTEVSLRAREEEGIPAHAEVSLVEYRPDSGRWLPVFALRCGDPSTPCTPEEMASEKGRALKLKDRCALSEVKSMRWTGGLSEGRYLSLDLTFGLLVEEAELARDPRCGAASKAED